MPDPEVNEALESMKLYMRVDHDIDDALIESMMEAAEALIREMCRIDDEDELEDYPKLVQAQRLLVSHFYDQRSVVDHSKRGGLAQMPWAVDALLANDRAMSF